MSKFFLYNGVKLPALPEWDKTVYPYAFIYIVTLDGTTGVYTLVVSSSSVMGYDGNGIICPAATVGQRYTVSEDSWAAAADSDDFYIKRDNLIYTVWANFDVLNSDGSVYVAASEPVPVAGKFPLREWVGWHVIGLCSRPLPMSTRVPVAWLYNGVRLPVIPVEVMANSYVYIFEYVEGSTYIAYGFDTKPTTVSVANLFETVDKLRVESGTYASANWYSTVPENWIGIETDKNPSDAALGRVDNKLSAIVWANFDIYTSDGSLFLAASAPIPVYE